MKRLILCLAGLVLTAGLSAAGEKGVMHCFVFTPVEKATDTEWDAFYKATDALPGKIDGLKHVWYGKLMRPLPQWNATIPDAEARTKIQNAGKGNADVTYTRRANGVCMWFADEGAYKAYGGAPAHKEWAAAYEKVRVYGTTTFQILGQ